MKHLKGLMFLVAVVTVFLWTGIGSADEILIGYTGPLSGPAAEYGRDCANGVEMAVQDINAAGGVKINGKSYLFKLEKMDDRVDPTQVSTTPGAAGQRAIAVLQSVFYLHRGVELSNEEKAPSLF